MTKSALVSEHLAHVVVIAVGSTGAATARKAFSDIPGCLHFVESTGTLAGPEGAKVADKLSEMARNTSGLGYLPAVMIVAHTSDADAVASIVGELRTLSPDARPRVWPTFTDGSVTDLVGFDAAIDELGTGACDVVLVTVGQSDVVAQRAALRAWLQIKVPAPASVLADLPDQEGKSCRYVALGAQTVSEQAAHDGSGSDVTEVKLDVTDAAEVVEAGLRDAADSASVVRVAQDAASRVCAAAEHFDVPELLQAENSLVKAIADIDRTLVSTLEGQVSTLVSRLLAEDAAANESNEEATPEAPTSNDAQLSNVEVGDRTKLISTLVQLASKGSMSRVFKKSRMTGIAEQITVAVRRDVAAAVDSVIEHVNVGVPSAIKRELAKLNAERAEAALAQRAEQGLRDQSDWNALVAATRSKVSVWTKVEPTGVRRSWGGGVPAPREYVVSASSSVIALSDMDRAMTVIDLRDEGTNEGLPRSATVLVAQYGLPLSALR